MTLREELQLLLEKHEHFQAVNRIMGITPDTRVVLLVAKDPDTVFDMPSLEEAVKDACAKSGLPELPVICLAGCDVHVL